VTGIELDEGATGKPWVAAEIKTVVDAYLDMLLKQVRGERYTKRSIVRDLQRVLPARSSTSIERKLANVSAILDEEGIAWIDGYKPYSHYQGALREEVLAAIDPGRTVWDALLNYQTTLVAPRPTRQATEDVLVPPPGSPQAGRRRSSVSLGASAFGALRDYRQRQLGAAGEEWVVDLERESLRRSGRPDLAHKVAWTARDVGDGAGYDVSSFRLDGRERLIEVKTTNLGPLTPFYITRWEVEFSRANADSYSLYRVHGFARDPRIYVLDGSVEERARLEPRVFLGVPA
jgi:hypothetical protein